LRHPLIEQIQVQQEIYVANDLSLDKVPGVLLYGTNAVGKTSFIKAVGVAIILAQAGFYVPATSFHFSPFHSLYTRILGNDNIYKGLSTFAVEMSELRTILQGADSRSLILGDELCSGTESVSAISIFVAGVQHLCNKKSSFLFATHMHEIVGFAEIREQVDAGRLCLKHMSVIYDREKDALVFDRKLKEGPGDSMYGLEVCKSLHLPGDFLVAANEIRMRHFPLVSTTSILSSRTSQYNSQKVVGLCEKCGKPGSEVHHLMQQKDADPDTQNIVLGDGSVVKKNHLANLMTLCSPCHDAFHLNRETGHVKVKTTRGSRVKGVKESFMEAVV
jgi:DNA mismatch repair protein MutS